MQRVLFYLARLRCPEFLVPHDSNALLTTSFRRTLLLWLYAIYMDPGKRLAPSMDDWARHEPTQPQMINWLHAIVRRLLLFFAVFSRKSFMSILVLNVAKIGTRVLGPSMCATVSSKATFRSTKHSIYCLSSWNLCTAGYF